VRELLAVRRREVMPLLAGIAFDPDVTRCEGSLLRAGWRHPAGRLWLLANLSGDSAERPRDWIGGEPIWGGAPGEALPPWSVFWGIGTA
jgi:maltooligosyltrehalose trehalohydrolase